MTRNQQATQTSYLNLKSVLERHAPTVKFEEHEAFDRCHQRWLERLDDIDTLSTQQAQLSSKGVSADNKAKRERLVAATLAVSKPARAWALENENAEVAQTMLISATALLRGSAKDATDLSQGVYDTASATATAAALASHRVTTAKLKALQDAIKKFAASVPVPRQKITSRKSATQRLELEFSEAERCLTEGLDLLIDQFQTDYPEFVAEFKNARVVASAPTTSAPVLEVVQPEIKVTPKAA